MPGVHVGRHQLQSVPITLPPSSYALDHGIPGPGTLLGALGHPRPRRPPYKSLPTAPSPPFFRSFAALSSQEASARLCPPSLAATLCCQQCSCPGQLLQVSAASPCATMPRLALFQRPHLRLQSGGSSSRVLRSGQAQAGGTTACRSLSAKMPSQTVDPDPTTHSTPSPLCRP